MGSWLKVKLMLYNIILFVIDHIDWSARIAILINSISHFHSILLNPFSSKFTLHLNIFWFILTYLSTYFLSPLTRFFYIELCFHLSIFIYLLIFIIIIFYRHFFISNTFFSSYLFIIFTSYSTLVPYFCFFFIIFYYFLIFFSIVSLSFFYFISIFIDNFLYSLIT